MAQPADEVVEYKVRHAVARHALHKLSGIIAAERRSDARKDRYASWFMRYGILVLVVVCAVSARFFGVF